MQGLEPFLEKEVLTSIRMGKNIKRPEVFDISYTPDEIYLRQEAEEISASIGFYLGSGIPSNLAIYGSRGTGKTTTIKYLLPRIIKICEEKGEIEKGSANIFYLRCRENPTTYKIYSSITGGKIGDHDLPKRALEKLTEKKYTFLVLDEADYLRDCNIIFTLTRETRVFLITIAQNIQFFSWLDQATQSSFSPVQVYFRPYVKEELFQILKQRAEKGLYNYSLNIVEKIAERVANEFFGDARIGIRALMFMGDRWFDDYIDVALMKAKQSVIEDAIQGLSSRELAILSLFNAEEEKSTDLMRRLSERYPRMRITKPTFLDALSYLQAQGLLLLIKGHGRSPTMCRLLVDRSLVNIILQERRFLGQGEG